MSNDSATLTRIRCIARQEEENVIHVCPPEAVQCAQLAKSMSCYYVFQITYSFFKLEKIVMTLLKIHETFSSFFFYTFASLRSDNFKLRPAWPLKKSFAHPCQCIHFAGFNCLHADNVFNLISIFPSNRLRNNLQLS